MFQCMCLERSPKSQSIQFDQEVEIYIISKLYQNYEKKHASSYEGTIINTLKSISKAHYQKCWEKNGGFNTSWV